MAGIVLSFISLSASAQQTWDAKKNPTVDSITSQYTSKYIAPRAPLTTNDIFPVIGQYESSNTEAPTLNISLDEQNKGVVWVDGLPQGKIKAMLRKSPAIYKIPAQKTAEGKEVAEGTLIFDKENNTLNIALGKTYLAEDPASVFSTEPITEEVPAKTSKSKTKKPATKKIWLYSGTKVTAETVSN